MAENERLSLSFVCQVSLQALMCLKKKKNGSFLSKCSMDTLNK